MPRKSRKKSKDKRMNVDMWVTDGLRAAVGALMRDDGKPANDTQVRHWAQHQMDDVSVKEVDKFEEHSKRKKSK
jgi:dsRNA-specific ribonuclease